MKKLTTIISVTAMMCAVMAALIFSIWLAVYGDSNYRFYKKEYQRYEVTEDLDMSIDHVMYVTEHVPCWSGIPKVPVPADLSVLHNEPSSG